MIHRVNNAATVNCYYVSNSQVWNLINQQCPAFRQNGQIRKSPGVFRQFLHSLKSLFLQILLPMLAAYDHTRPEIVLRPAIPSRRYGAPIRHCY